MPRSQKPMKNLVPVRKSPRGSTTSPDQSPSKTANPSPAKKKRESMDENLALKRGGKPRLVEKSRGFVAESPVPKCSAEPSTAKKTRGSVAENQARKRVAEPSHTKTSRGSMTERRAPKHSIETSPDKKSRGFVSNIQVSKGGAERSHAQINRMPVAENPTSKPGCRKASPSSAPAQRRSSMTQVSKTSFVSTSPELLECLHEIKRLPFEVYGISTIPGQKAWIVTYERIMLVDINSKILVQQECYKYSVVSALSNGEALYTSSNSGISRIDHTGKVCAFIDIEPVVNDILAVNDSVFVSTRETILKLDHEGKKIHTIECVNAILALMLYGEVAAINSDEKMMVIRASDCVVLKKDIDITFGCSAGNARTTLTVDRHGRIIIGNTCWNTLHVFEVVGETVTRLKDYTVESDYNRGVYAVDTDEVGNLWIGAGTGEIIVTKYCQTD